jgi:glycosyltransferase involved in cell wall biosynthesis
MRDLSKLRICYIVGTLGQGGAERQLFYAVQTLHQNGARVRVLSFEPGGFWETPIKDLGVPVTCVGEGGSRFRRILRIVKLLREDPVDIVQAQHFYTNAYAAVAALLLNCTGIGGLRSNGQFDFTQAGRIGGRVSMHLPKILAGNSRSSIEYAMSRGIHSSRLYFLPNVVDTDRFAPDGHDAAHRGNGPITLLAVGRLAREKRLDRFISIVHGLRWSGLDVRAWIVGSARPGENPRPKLERQAAELGLFPHSLQFLGSAADIASIYRQSTIFVLTSEYEGTPNVLLEAMAMGLPVVATAVGGVPDIVKDGETGFLIPRDDLKAQVAVIARLIRDSDLRARIAKQARSYIEENHSVHRLSGHLNRLYELAFSRRPARKTRAASVAPSARHSVLAPNPSPSNTIEEEEVYEH